MKGIKALGEFFPYYLGGGPFLSVSKRGGEILEKQKKLFKLEGRIFGTILSPLLLFLLQMLTAMNITKLFL